MSAASIPPVHDQEGAGSLLILSQVILSLQLSFAVIPLVYFTKSAVQNGSVRKSSPPAAVSWTVAVTIVGLNAWLLIGAFRSWVA